ncbi:MAG: 3-phosphoserine/phosphohydroxythreonine transaminase [Actinomycetota bacterium]
MNDRVWNFSAGPATLPLPVLEQARDELVSLPGVGASVLEISHRSKAFEAIVDETEANLRELLEIPETHRVLFLQGGASLQFAMVPMNFLGDRAAQYVVTGSWGKKAVAEARQFGAIDVVWDGAGDGYAAVPDLGELSFRDSAAYVHVTSNETIAGVELAAGFEGRVRSRAPLVCDASSDFLSRPVNVSRFGLIYAGAQKNAGPAGLTIVVLDDALAARAGEGVATMLDYRTHIEHRSLYNTPPTFAVYVLMLVTRWLRDEIGGLDKMAERNEEKAALLYEAIDASDGFYRGHATLEARSRMNVTWRLPDQELEKTFVDEARAHDLVELKGHRSVGGIRASIYNAMPVEGVRALRSFMDDFVARHA